MNALKILENEVLRDFVYDEERLKVFNSSRQGGKTFGIAMSMFLNSIEGNNSIFITKSTHQFNYIKQVLINICDCFQVTYNNEKHNMIVINNSRIELKSSNSITERFIGSTTKDLFIDEINYSEIGIIDELISCNNKIVIALPKLNNETIDLFEQKMFSIHTQTFERIDH